MTKKDYELMAEAFCIAMPSSADEYEAWKSTLYKTRIRAWADCIRGFCIVAVRDNRRFDPARFCTACGMPAQLAEDIIAHCST